MRKVYMMTRKAYKNIKKYDHQQMERFLQNVYHNGYEDGRKNSEGLSDEEEKATILMKESL